VERLVEEIVVETLMEELDLPHVMVCRDDTDSITLVGPYPTALAAVEAAARAEAQERAVDPDTDLAFGVQALNPTSEWA
jgi:hypothetical protein